MDMSTIFDKEDVFTSAQDAANALLKRWEKPASGDAPPDPDKRKAQEAPVETPEAPVQKPVSEAPAPDAEVEAAPEGQPEGEAEGEEVGEAEEGTTPAVAADDLTVEVLVKGELHRVPVKDLKRLYGQEAALTQKSQRVAEVTKEAEAAQRRYLQALEHEAKQAEENFARYRDVDWVMAARNLDAATLGRLREEANAAFTSYKYYTETLDGEMKELQTKTSRALQERAQECVKTLTDPEHPCHIEGWDAPTYNGIREFAVAQGFPPEAINQCVDPVMFKILHMAKSWQERKNVVGQVKLTTKPAVKASAQKVLTPGASTTGKGGAAKQQAMDKFRKTGTLEDAAGAFLAKWKK